MTTPTKILIIRFSAMGDVAMLVPVVHALATLYPDVHVTVLSRPFAQSFFEGLAPNVSFMAADLTTEYKGIRGLNALYRRLAAKQFTHIADMHGVLRSHYLRMRFLLNNYRVEHIDKHRKDRQALIRPGNKVFKQLPTSFRNYAEVLHRLGFPLKPPFRSIFGEGKGNLRLLPPEIGEKKAFQKWIGIAPFAALKHKGVVLRLIAVESSLTSDPQRLVAGEEHTFHNVAIGEVLEVIALGAPILQVHAAHPLARANPKVVVAIVKHTGDLIGGKQVWEEQRVAITLHMTAVVTVKAVGCANPHKPVVVLVECGDVVVGDGLRQVDRYKAHLGQRLALNRKDTQQQAGHEHAHPTPQGVASY